MENEKVTNEEILTAVNNFATKTEERFEKLEDKLETEISSVKTEISSVKTEISFVKSDLISVKSQMVTKDYLDKKVAEVRGELVFLVRKEDTKVNAITNKLGEKQVLSEQEKQDILKMDPFPQIF